MKEKRWRKFYFFLMLFFYIIYVPFSLVDWLFLDGKFPIIALFVGVALPFMRKNHLRRIRLEKS